MPTAISAIAAFWADRLIPGRRFPIAIIEYMLEAAYEDHAPADPDGSLPSPEPLVRTRGTITRWLREVSPRLARIGIPAGTTSPRSYAVPEGLDSAYSVPRELARYYIGLLRDRQRVNDERGWRYAWVRVAVGISLVATAVELIISLVVRL